MKINKISLLYLREQKNMFLAIVLTVLVTVLCFLIFYKIEIGINAIKTVVSSLTISSLIYYYIVPDGQPAAVIDYGENII